MSKGHRLVTMLCADAEPHVESVVDTCSMCGRAVWRGLNAPEFYECVCTDCFALTYEPERDEIQIHDAQVEEVKEYLAAMPRPPKGRTSN